MRKIGYIRVSTKEQNLARKRHQLIEIEMDKMYEEKISGKRQDNRPKLQEMLNDLQVLLCKKV